MGHRYTIDYPLQTLMDEETFKNLFSASDYVLLNAVHKKMNSALLISAVTIFNRLLKIASLTKSRDCSA